MKLAFDKAFSKLFADYVPGTNYDFSHGTMSNVDLQRYEEVAAVIEASLKDFNEGKHPTISLKVYNFLGDASSPNREF